MPVFGSIAATAMVIEQLRQGTSLLLVSDEKGNPPNVNINRFDLALHAIKRDNTYDLFIRSIISINRNETIDEAEHRMDAFIREMTASLFQFLREKGSSAIRRF